MAGPGEGVAPRDFAGLLHYDPDLLPPRDTSDEAWAIQLAIWRRMRIEGRTAAASGMIGFARRASLDAIRSRHPEYDDHRARMAMMRMLYGDVLFTAAWPGEPLLDP